MHNDDYANDLQMLMHALTPGCYSDAGPTDGWHVGSGDDSCTWRTTAGVGEAGGARGPPDAIQSVSPAYGHQATAAT
jgi:hypothetical protein